MAALHETIVIELDSETRAKLAAVVERLDWLRERLEARPTSTPHRCPVCTGTGKVSRPPWPPGDLPAEHGYTTANTLSYQCNACLGRGIVWAPTTAIDEAGSDHG